jgi:ribosome maturation factor RimP
LYNLEYKRKKSGNVLTVYIDNEKDITIDDCVEVTHKLDPFLDELDPINESYFLEVSSPGAEKELRNTEAIKKAIGRYVHVETYEQKIDGYLEAFDGNVVSVKNRNKIININYEEINLIRLAIKF